MVLFRPLGKVEFKGFVLVHSSPRKESYMPHVARLHHVETEKTTNPFGCNCCAATAHTLHTRRLSPPSPAILWGGSTDADRSRLLEANREVENITFVGQPVRLQRLRANDQFTPARTRERLLTRPAASVPSLRRLSQCRNHQNRRPSRVQATAVVNARPQASA